MEDEIKVGMLLITVLSIDGGKPMLLVGRVIERDSAKEDAWIINYRQIDVSFSVVPKLDLTKTVSVPSRNLMSTSNLKRERSFNTNFLELQIEKLEKIFGTTEEDSSLENS